MGAAVLGMFFDVFEHVACAHDLEVVVAEFFGLIGGEEIEIRLSDEIFPLHSEKIAETLVGEEEFPVYIFAEDEEGEAFQK